MKYTDEDLERARVFLNRYSPDDTDVAQLIADVRAEALESAIKVTEGTTGDAWDVARRLRLLKDGP